MLRGVAVMWPSWGLLRDCETSNFAKVRFQLYCKESPAWWHGAQCNEVPPPVGLVTGYQHSSALLRR